MPFPALLGNTCDWSDNEHMDSFLDVSDRATPQPDNINMREDEYHHEEEEGSRHDEGEGNNEEV